MPNLRTILEDLVKNIQPGDLTDYRKEMIEDAEDRIKELMLGEEEIIHDICLLAQEEIKSAELTRLILHENNFNKATVAIHSAMLKKLED